MTIFAIGYKYFRGYADIRYITLFITLLGITFSIILASHHHLLQFQVEHGHAEHRRLSYIHIHVGTHDPYRNRTLPPVSIDYIHSDHYVLLAKWLSQRLPQLAEYKEDPQAGLSADEIGFRCLNAPQGRIKPFGWLELNN